MGASPVKIGIEFMVSNGKMNCCAFTISSACHLKAYSTPQPDDCQFDMTDYHASEAYYKLCNLLVEELEKCRPKMNPKSNS